MNTLRHLFRPFRHHCRWAVLFALATCCWAADPTGAPALSTYERLAVMAQTEELPLADSVMLRARLLYAPDTFAAACPFTVAEDEVAVHEECLTSFYRDASLAIPQLSPAEQALLASFSPDLAALVRVTQTDCSATPAALPTYPLELTETGTSCIVHYTLTGTHAAPSDNYAKLVRKYLDEAIAKMTKKDFVIGYCEGNPGYGGKMHVYLIEMSANGTCYGYAAGGKACAAYLSVYRDLPARYGDTWEAKLKGVCNHEYFHAIQYRQNAWCSSWLLEAGAVWASCFYGKDWGHLRSYYDDSASVFQAPNRTLWEDSYRKYSTSALLFHLSARFGKQKFVRACLDRSVTQDDAVLVLRDVVANQGGNFAEEYVDFLAAMYAKKITGVKATCLPDVVYDSTITSYGKSPANDTVVLTGASFYRLDKPTHAAKSIYAEFGSGSASAAAGNPTAFLLVAGSAKPIEFNGVGKAVMKAGKGGVLVVTDATYTNSSDTASRTFHYGVLAPTLKVLSTEAESPIYAGDYSEIDLYYDLIGGYSAGTPVTIKIIEKGPDVADYASGDYDIPAGPGSMLPFYFMTNYATQGNYKFTIELAVPPGSWELPQLKSKGSCTVKVLSWAAAAPAAMAARANLTLGSGVHPTTEP
jgi:hypothetical protein